MELKIDLSDRADIEAGHALLALLINNTEAPKYISHADSPSTGLPPAAEVFAQPVAPVAPVAPVVTAAPPAMDAQAVFGGAAAQIPLPVAPSIAAAVQLPTAPVAPMPGQIAPTAPSLPAAMPAPVVPAPSAPAAPASPAAGVERDSRGMPWDARIHASTKSKTKAGQWVAKRGLNDDTFVAQVEAEILALVNSVPPAPVAASAAPLPQPPAMPVAQPTIAPAVPLPSPGLPAPVPAADGAALPVPPADPTTFEQLMPLVSAAINANRLGAGALQAAVTARGLPGVVALQTAPQWVPTIWADLKAAHPGAL